MASVMTCSPESGSTKTCTPCTPDPSAQLLRHWPPLGPPVLLGRETFTSHAAKRVHSATIARQARAVERALFLDGVLYIDAPFLLELFRVCLLAITSACSRLRRLPDLGCGVEQAPGACSTPHPPFLRGERGRSL